MSLGAILSGASAVGGLLGQLDSNNGFSAQQQADQAAMMGLVSRQSSLFDTLTNLANTENAQGAFDPSRQLQTLQAQTDHDSQIATGNAAGAAATMGYRAGDSAPLQQINSLNNEYKLGEQQLGNQIIDQKLAEKNAAYSLPTQINLSGAYGALGQNAALNASQITSPAGLVGSVMPFLSSLQTATPAPSGYQQNGVQAYESPIGPGIQGMPGGMNPALAAQTPQSYMGSLQQPSGGWQLPSSSYMQVGH